MNIFEQAIFHARIESSRKMVARAHGEAFANQIFGAMPDQRQYHNMLMTTVSSFLTVMERAGVSEIIIDRGDMVRNINEWRLTISDDGDDRVHVERVKVTKGGG